MKKNLIGSLILILVLTLFGCSNEEKPGDIYKEFSRLSALIPGEFENDLELPRAADSFELIYFLGDLELTNYVLEFTLMPSNTNVILELVLSNGVAEESYYIALVQLGDEQLYEETMLNLHFDTVFNEISNQIPSTMISNTSLPLVDDENDVLYNIDCTDISRNRLVYSFPTTALQCNLDVQVTYEEVTRSKVIFFEMAAVNDLPNIPTLYITTVGGEAILSDEVYVPGFLTLVVEGETNFPEIENAELGIRLRGNSTLMMPKKPYKIKFAEKQALLSGYSEKQWVLLANHVDQTLLRNYLAFSMASKLDMGVSPSFNFVDVYINGVYQGNYLLTDQVEVSENRVDVEEKVSSVNTGYLVEYDIGLYREGLENTLENYFLIDNIPFVIKSPDFEDDHYVEAQKVYIEEYFNLVLNTLKVKGDYSNLIDETSFIDWFIVNEVFKNVDSGYSSVYFNKDKDGLLKMGPVWDFDISSGVPGYVSPEDRGPTGWWTARSDKNVFFYYLMEYPTFRENLKDRWNEVYENSIEVVLDEILYASDLITLSSYNNFELWDIIGVEQDWYTSPEILSLITYDEQVWFLYDYLKTRIQWMNTEINNF